MACQGCGDSAVLDFEFTMAFQPIVDLRADRIWGYEALVRGLNGEGAGEILQKVTDENRYRFDQACRVKAVELALSSFRRTTHACRSISCRTLSTSPPPASARP